MNRIPPLMVNRSRLRWQLPALGLVISALVTGTPAAVVQDGAAAVGDPMPRPLAVWPPGPLEVVAAFDRPVAPAVAAALIGRTIPYGDARTELAGRPPLAGPSGKLRIVGARLVDDGRTLIMATDPHPRAARYRLPLPATAGDRASGMPDAAMVAYDLSGVEATWSERDDPAEGRSWSGWWPQLDLDATRRLTRGSRPHEVGLALLDRPGRLSLSAWVRLPPGKAAFRVEAAGPIESATLGDAELDGEDGQPADGVHRGALSVESRAEPLFLTMTVRTGAGGRPFSLRASYRPASGSADRPIGRELLLVPWAPISTIASAAAPIAVPDLSGGDAGRGRTIFRSDQARCVQCHVFRGEGGKVGPDLSGLAGKSRADIYRSIAAPSATIEPDYTTYTVAARDGRVLSGVVRADGPEAIAVIDSNAHSESIRRDEIQEIRPSATSIMPPGLAAALGDSAVRDLIAYLTSTPLPGGRSAP